MPEGIVFRRHIPRGLRSVARRLFAPALTQKAVDDAVLARAKDLRRQGGFPCLYELAHVIERLNGTACAPERLMSALAELDSITHRSGHANTILAAQRARQLLLTRPERTIGMMSDVTPVVRQLADYAVADFIISAFHSKPLCSELVESGLWTVQGLTTRRAEISTRLLSSRPFRTLVDQLLSNPDGSEISLPRATRPKPSTADLLLQALTEDLLTAEAGI